MTAPDACPTCGARRGYPSMISVAFDAGRATGRAFPVGAPDTRLFVDALVVVDALRAARAYIGDGVGLRVTTLRQLDAALKMIGGE